MKTPYKVGVVATGIFAFLEMVAFLEAEGFDYLGLMLVTFVGASILILYFLFVFTWYKNKIIFFSLVILSIIIIIGFTTIKVVDRIQSRSAFDVSKATPLNLSEEVRQNTRGRYPLYDLYKITIPMDGNYRINFSSDAQVMEDSLISVWALNPHGNDLFWDAYHYKNGLPIVYNAKKGQTYQIHVNQRDLSKIGKASYYTIEVESVNDELTVP